MDTETVTLTIPRKTLDTLVFGFMASVAKTSGGAFDSGKRLMRELESGKPLSQELVTELIGYAVSWRQPYLAQLLAEAFRPDGDLTFEERLPFDLSDLERHA